MKAYLAILKRFEIWLLFAVVAALLVYALKPHPSPTASARDDSETPEPQRTALAAGSKGAAEGQRDAAGAAPEASGRDAPPPLAVESVRVTPSAGGRIVELALHARSPGDAPLPLDEATLVATTRDGSPVPRFFEPFSPEPLALPGDGGEAVVRYWLESPADALWLDFSGETAKAELPE